MAMTPVFYKGLLAVDAWHVKSVSKDVSKPNSKSPPKPVMVVAPMQEGTYPVIVFLHGCNLANHYYEQLLKHVASHGFIAVAPQLYWMTFVKDDGRDVNAAKQVTNWLASEKDGLQFVLDNNPKLDNVKPELSKLALAGHSRGGHAAFALALGLGEPEIKLELKFSALIGVDPVAGEATGCQIAPKVLTLKPRSLDVGMPTLVLGTGKGPEHVGGPPCAPAGVNHAEFYNECSPPRYHFVAKEYGHADMLDDDAPYVVDRCMCARNENGTKKLARQSMGGVMVAFLRAILEDKNEDLKTILDNPALAPAILNPVEHDLA